MLARILFRPTLRAVGLGLLIAGSLVLLASPVHAADGVVGNGVPGSCTESEFDRVFGDVQASGGGSIDFNCGPTAHSILFTSQKVVIANSVLHGGDLVTLGGGRATALFRVEADSTLTLSRIVLAGAYSPSGAVENFGRLNLNNSTIRDSTATGSGGAIANHGDLTLTHAIIEANNARGSGGGIFTDGGATTIINSRFAGNTAFEGGGAVLVTGGAVLTVSGSQFVHNQAVAAGGEGGAIRSAGTLKIIQSIFSLNSASLGGALEIGDGRASIKQGAIMGNWGTYGGGIRQDGGELGLLDVRLSGNGFDESGGRLATGGGAISWAGGSAVLWNVTMNGNGATYGAGFEHEDGNTTLTNVTISGNTAVVGGACDLVGGSVSLVNVTIAGNSASFLAAGIGNRAGALKLVNVLLADNLQTDGERSSNCYKAAWSSFNMSSDDTCSFGPGYDDLVLPLGPLAYNGGFTQTHLLESGNPAIDGGILLGCPPADQRGMARPQGITCDIGAVEASPTHFAIARYMPVVRR